MLWAIDKDMILVGEPALQRLVTYPDLTIANFKRAMGSNQSFKFGDYSFRAEELSALLLKQLKEDAEIFLNTPIREAIISVPAYFSDAQRKATKVAAELAGLYVERLINEPTAAGIAYGLQQQMDDSHYLIFDLGGATFDVSILNMFSSIIEVNASSGDNFLGGIDFTHLLEEMFIEKELNKENIPPIIRTMINEQAEFAKRKLSTEERISMKIRWQEKDYEFYFSHDDFEQKIEPLLQRLKNPIQKNIT